MSHFARLIPHCFRNLALQLGRHGLLKSNLLTERGDGLYNLNAIGFCSLGRCI